MLDLLKNAFNSEGLRQTSITTIGNVLVTILSAIALILISRLLGPSQFGEFSVGFSIVLILTRINDLGLNATQTKFIPKLQTKKEINQFFGYTFRIKLIFSLLLFLIGIIATPYIASLLNFQDSAIIYAAFFLSICTTWYEQLLSLLQAMHRFGPAVFANAAQATLKLIGAFLFFILNLNLSLPVFILYASAPLAPIFLSKFFLPKWFKPDLKKINNKNKQKIWKMAKFSSIGFITAGLVQNVDVLFVRHYLDAYETGLLAGISRIASMLLLVGFSLASVLNARVSKYQSKEHLQPYIKKSFLFLFLVFIGFILSLPFTRFLILITIGPEYISGINIMYILLANAFLTVASVPFLALFYSLKADWYFMLAGITQTIIVILGNFLFVPQFGILASALTKLGVGVLLFTLTVGISLYLYNKKYKQKIDFDEKLINNIKELQ